MRPSTLSLQGLVRTLHQKTFSLILVRLPSIKVGDFDADTVSSEIIMRNLSHSGCLQFQYGSTNAADAFRLKIAVINRRSRTYLQNFIVSGRLFKLNLRLLSTQRIKGNFRRYTCSFLL